MKALIKTTKQSLKDGNHRNDTYLMGIFATEPSEYQLKRLIEKDVNKYNGNQTAANAKMYLISNIANNAIRTYVDARWEQTSFTYYLIDTKMLG